MGVERVDYYNDQEYEQAIENEEACYRGWQDQQWAEERAAREDYERPDSPQFSTGGKT